jgi:hypothetical protein
MPVLFEKINFYVIIKRKYIKKSLELKIWGEMAFSWGE